jgi:hypothetical protein
MVYSEAFSALFCRLAVSITHPQEMGTNQMNASECHFFEKTAWQIGKAFVLAHSHRAKR